MHLDLSASIPPKAWQLIASLVQKHGLRKPKILWHDWVVSVDTETTSPIILQACAQVLASHRCAVSTIVFGAYCSKHYKFHGQVLSDEVAFYYLHRGITAVKNNQVELLAWLTASKAHCYVETLENDFWINACAAYLEHTLSHSHRSRTDTSDFAFSVVSRAQKRKH